MPANAQNEPTVSRRTEEPDARHTPPRKWHLFVASGLTFYTRDLEGETDYYRVPMIARISNGRLRFSASIPYLIIRGPGGNVSDDETDDTGSTTPETRKGFGDLNLQVRYRLPPKALAGFDLDLLGRVKFGTASHAKRLGTGETDYIVGAELSRDLGSVEPFVYGQSDGPPQ